MGYFEFFPKYLTALPDGSQIVITDFFRRIKVNSRYNAAVTTLMPYTIGDGEQPEMVSNKVYGSPLYHWVVIHVNNIVSIYNEWPLSTLALINKIYYTYDFTIGVPDITEFSVGNTLTTTNGGELVVTSINVGSITATSTKGQTFITPGQTLLTNVSTGVPGLIILSVVDPQYQLHHYEDSVTGYQIDYNPSNPNCVPVNNLEYEIAVNDAKRNIQLLDPTYLQDFVTNFENSINA